MDLSKYSDAELQAMLSQKQAQQKADLSGYSDAELKRMANIPLTMEEERAEFERKHPNTPKWMVDMVERTVKNNGNIPLRDNINLIAKGATEGANDALDVPERILNGASLGAWDWAGDKLANYAGRPDLSPKARAENLEKKYDGYGTVTNAAAEITGSIPTGKAFYDSAKTVISAIPKYGSTLSKGVIPVSVAGGLEGGIHGGFTNGLEGMAFGSLMGAGLPLAIKGIGTGIKYAGKGAKHLLGMTTGTSSDSVQQAYDAGKRGSKTFLNNMRKKEPMENVLDDVYSGMKELKENATKEYNSLKPEIFGDKTKLNPKPVKDAFNKIKNDLIYPAQKYESGGVTENTLKRVEKVLDDFMIDTPNHNAAGFDAYKQRVGEILQGIDYKNKDARKVAGGVYNAMKNTIGKQAPKYYELTSKYADAMDDIVDLQKAFSLKSADKTNVDTALRKIQSVMRNNVNTNYGKRLELLDKLYNSQEIKDKIAGQFMSEVVPRGLTGKISGVSGIATIAKSPETAIPLIVSSSPRAVGEATYKAGQIANKVEPLSKIISELQKTGVIPYFSTMKGE